MPLTERFDLATEDAALAYKLFWDIEKFFGWWKQHLNVYHLIAQILGGLITYLPLTIYCHEEHNERVSINRVRELRIKIKNELDSERISAIYNGAAIISKCNELFAIY